MDIEKKALELVNDARAEAGRNPVAHTSAAGWYDLKPALFRAIEALEADNARHAAEMEAFKREVSDVAAKAIEWLDIDYVHPARIAKLLQPFIIPQVDPLAEVLACLDTSPDPSWDYAEDAASLRAALAARGLELVKKEPSQ